MFGNPRPPMREGADDARRIASLINGRRVTREELRAELRAPIPDASGAPAPAPLVSRIHTIWPHKTPMPAAPRRVQAQPAPAEPAPAGVDMDAVYRQRPAPPAVHTPATVHTAEPAQPPAPAKALSPTGPLAPRRRGPGKRDYLPQPGMLPRRILDHLQAHGGHLTSAQISTTFGVAVKSVGALLALACKHGLLQRQLVAGRMFYSLRGHDVQVSAPAPAAECEEAPVYRPHARGIPRRVIDHLQAHGGHLTSAEVAARFGVRAKVVSPTLARACQSGQLRMHFIGNRAYFTLPDAPAPDPAQRIAAPAAGAPSTAADDVGHAVQTVTNAIASLTQEIDRLTASVQALRRALPPEPTHAH